ncbi:hypothetical protein B7P43_G07892 [Cryptotermes secundus]|uniref:Protein takeout n=1 Tax=Cryptotermes secundus TaxID=105785 RepID=A0A2J7QTH9_9NEOP|nr:hypothetical protein B7P43_G07892 [Cryptotermes secundus]
MSKLSIFFAVCAVVCQSEALKLPDYITPCSRKDPNFNECALKHGREAIPRLLKGDPKYGVPVLDPMYVPEVSVEESGIKITARNFTIEGARNATLQDFRVDFDKLIVSIQFMAPQLDFRGKYELSGKLVSLPIVGKGDYNATLGNLTAKYTTQCNLTKQGDGRTYLSPQDYDLEFDPKTASMYFGNLFNGNKLLGDAMNSFIAENWRLVLDQIGKPAYRALGMIVHQILVQVAHKVPYDELFSDTD